MPCYSPLNGWKDEETGGIVFKGEGRSETMQVACGQCLGCRLDHSRMWAMRCVHEASLWEYIGGNSFVTLTYRSREDCSLEQLENGFHVPDDWSLHKAHFQKFMKRLRKAYPLKIRYFMCGEYGRCCKHGIDVEQTGCPLCRVGRPHYHAILFNLSCPDLVAYSSDGGSLRYTSEWLEGIWKYGFVDVGEATFQSCAYVARYVLKKINGLMSKEYYLQSDMDGVLTDLVPEYVAMSRKPGIGHDWYQRFKSDLFPSDEVPVPGSGVLRGMPRYYDELLRAEDELLFAEVKARRQEFRLENSGELLPDRLMARYRVKAAQVRSLRRKLA